jgi:hypothetical protein
MGAWLSTQWAPCTHTAHPACHLRAPPHHRLPVLRMRAWPCLSSPKCPPVCREARWLLATCWNAGLSRLRAGDRRGAAPLLKAGLALQRHAAGWGAADRGAMERVAAEAGVELAGVA